MPKTQEVYPEVQVGIRFLPSIEPVLQALLDFATSKFVKCRSRYNLHLRYL